MMPVFGAFFSNKNMEPTFVFSPYFAFVDFVAEHRRGNVNTKRLKPLMLIILDKVQHLHTCNQRCFRCLHDVIVPAFAILRVSFKFQVYVLIFTFRTMESASTVINQIKSSALNHKHLGLKTRQENRAKLLINKHNQ